MLIKLYDVLARILLYAVACLLTKTAKVRTTCWAMSCMAKKATHAPIILEQATELGVLSLEVTGTWAQLRWRFPSSEDGTTACDPACQANDPNRPETSHAHHQR